MEWVICKDAFLQRTHAPLQVTEIVSFFLRTSYLSVIRALRFLQSYRLCKQLNNMKETNIP